MLTAQNNTSTTGAAPNEASRARPQQTRARQTRALERRQAILETTWQLICTRGFDATGVNNIISELGISKGSFYHHFHSKAAVLDAVIEMLTTDVIRRVQADNARAPAVARLNALIQSGWQWHEEHAAISAEMFTVMMRPENTALLLQISATEQRVLRPLFENIIAQGIAEQSFDVPDATIATDFLLPFVDATLLRISRNAINGDLDTTGFIAQINFLRQSLERMLGAPAGALAAAVPDEQTLGLVVAFLDYFQHGHAQTMATTAVNSSVLTRDE